MFRHFTHDNKTKKTRIHSSTKLPPIQASLKRDEGFAYKKLLHRRYKIKPKQRIGDLVRTADLKKTFTKGDITNWSHKLKEITEILKETILS